MSDAKHRIVVIEDNSADVQLLDFALQDAQLDFEFIVIPDGQQALAWVRGNSKEEHTPLPELAIIDLNLPKHDGIEILEAIRGTPALARVPVLVLSSSPRPSDVSRVNAFTNTRYATKPTFLEEYGEIAAAVRAMLRPSS
jgi:CheY-like chemotaxis protein